MGKREAHFADIGKKHQNTTNNNNKKKHLYSKILDLNCYWLGINSAAVRMAEATAC